MRLPPVCLLMTFCVCLTANEDPLSAPEDYCKFIRRITYTQRSPEAKLQAIAEKLFAPVSAGGLGLTYDNSRTRALQEAWQERKGNCVTLAAFYVAACNAIGYKASFAEAPCKNKSQKVGCLVARDRHMVALVHLPNYWIAADGATLGILNPKCPVTRLAPDQVRAIFLSNRAVSALKAGNPQEAMMLIKKSLEMAPKTGIAWNVLGAIHKTTGQPREAEQAFCQALKLESQNIAALTNLEQLLNEQGRHEEAKRYQEMAQKITKS